MAKPLPPLDLSIKTINYNQHGHHKVVFEGVNGHIGWIRFDKDTHEMKILDLSEDIVLVDKRSGYISIGFDGNRLYLRAMIEFDTFSIGHMRPKKQEVDEFYWERGFDFDTMKNVSFEQCTEMYQQQRED